MGKLLFIEANTTGTGMISIEKAKELDLQPVFLTNNPERYVDLHKQGCEIMTCDTNNISKLIATIDHHFKLEEIKGITTTSEFYIHTVSVLTEKYNLNGNHSYVMGNVRNKASVRELLKHSNVLYQPTYFIIESVESLMGIKDEILFPCIVKPVDDSGSNGVLQCNDFETLKTQAKELLSIEINVRNQERTGQVLIEELVEGQEYSVETFSYKGSHQVIGITRKLVEGAPFFVENGHVFPAPDIERDSKFIQNGVMEILNTLNWEEGPAHIEFKIKDDKIFLVEFNGRLAGGMIPVLISYATGLDLVKEQVKAAAGIEPGFHHSLKQYAGIRFLMSNQAGEVAGITGMDCTAIPEIKEIKYTVDIGGNVEKATNAYGRFGHIIAVSSDHEKLTKKLNNVMNQIKIEVKEHIHL